MMYAIAALAVCVLAIVALFRRERRPAPEAKPKAEAAKKPARTEKPETPERIQQLNKRLDETREAIARDPKRAARTIGKMMKQ